MNVFVTVLAALSVALIYSGITAPPADRGPVLMRRLDALAVESGIRNLTSARLIGASVGAGALTFVLIAGLTSSAPIAAVLALAATVWPFGWVRGIRSRRRRRFRDAWPDALAALIASVRAGTSLAEACIGIGKRGPEPLRPGFLAFTTTYLSSGSFPTGIARMRSAMADPIADRVGLALQVAYEVGGTDLVRVLRATSDFVRDDIRVRKEIEARWSWTVTAARVAAAAPWIVLIMMATRPEAAAAYDTPVGLAVIAGGAAATFLGYRLMLRAGRLPEDRRLS